MESAKTGRKWIPIVREVKSEGMERAVKRLVKRVEEGLKIQSPSKAHETGSSENEGRCE
jgi:hypothetical protein